MEFPICGCFKSKKGVSWHYKIYSDLTVEQWHGTAVRCNCGWRRGPDVYSPKCTKELKKHIKEKYGLEVRD